MIIQPIRKEYPTIAVKKYHHQYKLNIYLLFSDNLKSVSISLAQQDVRKAVTVILSTCNLPTTYVDQIAPEPKFDPAQALRSRVYTYTQQARKHYEEYDYTNNSRIKRPERKTKPPKELQSLR